MDSTAITSAAQAVHQELVRKLAEQARINRLRDQLRRARPGAVISSSAAIPSPTGRADRCTHAQPDAGSWLAPTAPCSFAFGYSAGPADPGGPVGHGLDSAAGVPGLTGSHGAVTLPAPTLPAPAPPG